RGARVCDRSFDLPAMANDRRVPEEAINIALRKSCNSFGIEIRECAPKRVALTQDREPREPSLEPFQAKLLVEANVVDGRPTPLVVVVRDILRRARTPCAARAAVGA